MSSFTAAINAQAAVIAAASRNQSAAAGSSGMAILVGLQPAEIPARGDREVTVGGHMFVPGVPGLYQCKWATSNGVVIMSEPVAAINSNVVRCTNPRWTHSYSTRDWATTFSLTEQGVDLPQKSPLVQSWTAAPPDISMVHNGPRRTFSFDTGINVTSSEAPNQRFTFYVGVADPDTDIALTRLSATFTNRSFIRDIAFLNQGTSNVTVIVQTSTVYGISDISITGSDNLRMNATRTFRLQIAPMNYVRIFRTRSNRHTDFGRINNPRWAADNAAYGMYRAFDTLTGVTHIRIEKEDSAGTTPAGTATYRLVETATDTLRNTIQNRCGQYRGHNQWSQLNSSPDVDRWTNAWSGRKVSGDLQMRARSGGLADLPYFYLCGINTRSDWDWGTVAFTRLRTGTGDMRDNWRDQGMIGTIWSAWNGDNYPNRHWNQANGYPGYKGNNQGVYTISVCAGGNGACE
jgi:hypothetical protein